MADIGNPNLWVVMNKVSSAVDGWVDITKGLEVEGDGVLVQTYTHQLNPDGSHVIAKAIEYVPGVELVDDGFGGKKLEVI